MPEMIDMDQDQIWEQIQSPGVKAAIRERGELINYQTATGFATVAWGNNGKL